MKKMLATSILTLVFTQLAPLSATMAKPEKLQEQLVGPVKTVLIAFAKLHPIDGKWVPESPRIPWLETIYAKNGYRIEEEQFYTEKTLDFKSAFHYDGEGNLSGGVEYDYQGTVAFKWTYSHHPEEKRIEKRQVFSDGALFSITNYIYDDLGNLVEEIRFLQQTKNSFRWTFLYDSKGRKIEEAYYLSRPGNAPEKMQSLLNFRAFFTYDKAGNLIEETQYDASGKIGSKRRFQYKYDPAGNWITQTALEGAGATSPSEFKPDEITYRTITYYQP